MALKTPVVYDNGAHKVLTAGSQIPATAIQLSADPANVLEVRPDGFFARGSENWFDAAFTTILTFPAGVSTVPEVGGGWQFVPLTLLKDFAGHVTNYVSSDSKSLILAPGRYFGSGQVVEFNVPPDASSNSLYLGFSELDGSPSNFPRVPIGVSMGPFADRDGTRRMLSGPIAFSIPRQLRLGITFTPYGVSWNLDSSFQLWVAPL